MKRFLWKIVFCTVPVLLGVLIVSVAYAKYLNGAGGFRLGIDLAGGTDLIYEVDTDRFPDDPNNPGVKKPPDVPPGSTIEKELAASLKRRIDPADLYNVTIRPAGMNRVEIILPTGGEHQSQADDKLWNEFLEKVDKEYPPHSYKVAEGRTTELIARINEQYPQVPIYATTQAEANKDKEAAKFPPVAEFVQKNFNAESVKGDQKKLSAAWNDLLAKAAKAYPPWHYEVGRGRTQILANRVREQYPDKSLQEIDRFIEENYKTSGGRRLFTSEQVQEVKELISRVGSLEFRIIANEYDDKEALDAAKNWYAEVQKNPERRKELDRRAVLGQAPAPPEGPDRDLYFPVKNDKDADGIPVKHTYSWVELGRAERHRFGVDNSQVVLNSPWYKQVAEAREKGEVVTIPPNLMQGSPLLFSRPVLNPRLPEKEANKKYEYFILTRDPEKGKEITGNYLVRAYEAPGNSGLGLSVGFEFNQRGGELFGELTKNNKPDGQQESDFHRSLCVVLDGKIESAARINAIITTNGVIEGKFTKDEVDRLVRIFRAGALPATLKPQPVSESTMGATLGEDTIRAGTWSVMIAFVAVLFFMLVYYRFAGFVACVALLANLILTVAFMVMVNATFTLPGLAGLVLMLGMAVDANVLIYERLREERDRGASLPLAIRNGYDRAFPTIIDTHLSSIFTAIVLYAVGNDQLKGFGISLTVGLIISLFTSLYMTRLLFDLWQAKGWLKKLSMFRLLSRPNIDFMAIRYYWFTATVVLTIVGAAIFLYRMPAGLNIDFTKGTAYGGKLTKFMEVGEVRSLLNSNELPDRSVDLIFVNDQEFSQGKKSKLFVVRTSEQDLDKVQDVIARDLVDKSVNPPVSLLAKTELKDFKIDSDQHAVLTFVDPVTNQPSFASRAQVSRVLTSQFMQHGFTADAQDYVLEGLGAEKEGHFQWMDLQLARPVDKAKLAEILTLTKDELARKPQPELLETFDSALATDTQLRALYAILASWAAILLYLWFRFGNWTFGLAAVLCLIHDLFFTLGIIGFCHYLHEWMPGVASALLIQDFKIDLATVAALLTLVGYSVSDTIVVFDRIREVRGKNPLLTPQTINDSVNQTLSRTLLTAFSVWLVVIVLYIFGGEGVHLFAFVMVVGVFVGTYSSIYIASPLLLMFGEGSRPTSARERQPEPQPAGALS
ncbi:MAG TPA: protein translocase subunit SecD [Gemmataceae bacterium]|jgi:SecD/SecF fusion protein|nr:protein translocase subunit SecD [Gemmataceae bacterium]